MQSLTDEIASIQAEYGQSNAKFERLADKSLKGSDTIIVSGIGCTLRVKSGALCIWPGRTHAAQGQGTVILHRGTHSIKQIVLLGSKGLITLDSIRWAVEQGISIIMLDGHGNLMQTLAPENESSAALRRIQYQVASRGLDVPIARWIVDKKISGQIAVLKACQFPVKKTPIPQTVQRLIAENSFEISASQPEYDATIPFQPIWYYLERELRELPYLDTLTDIRLAEGRSAIIYWFAYQGTPLRWVSADVGKVPPHWRHITKRSSPLAPMSTAQHAVNPFHGSLNYAYSILQAQCQQALLAQGFDPVCGILHTDQLHRPSLVFDLMELHRPAVDRLVFNLFKGMTLSKGDFMSTQDGSVKFNPQFSRYLAASYRLPQADIDASAHELKQLLLGSAGTGTC